LSNSYDAFISYSSGDVARAQALYQRLATEGLRVWFDKARLVPGCNWYGEIAKANANSRIILPVLTPPWRESEWTRFETYGAEYVIPLLYEGDFSEIAPPPLFEYQFLDMRGDAPPWGTLLASIRTHLATSPPEKASRLAHVPTASNPYFVGRERQLLELHEKLHRNPTAALTQSPTHVIAGMGGVGKTTLAREYAERYWRLYTQILWVRAEAPVMATEFARLSVEMGIIRQPSQDPYLDALMAMNQLSSSVRRLLILDNAVNEESIQKWIPKGGGCRTIITSRFTGWSPTVQCVHVYVLEPEPARELLFKRSGIRETPENRMEADRLAEELGYLPLALEQAAAYMHRVKIDFSRYLELYARSRRDLLAKRTLGSTQYPDSVATTWLTTVRQLRGPAQAILVFSSFLAPDAIPRTLLDSARSTLEKEIFMPADARSTWLPDNLWLNDALGELNAYSMIALRQNAYTVHRLVQAVQREALNEQDRSRWAKYAVEALAAAFPYASAATWETCAGLAPHARLCTEYIEQFQFRDEPAARTLGRYSEYLHQMGQFGLAEILSKEALAITEETFGPETLEAATFADNLGLLLWDKGEYQSAEPFYERALTLRRRLLDPNHKDVALSLNNMGALRYQVGNYNEAEQFYTQALAIRERIFGPESSYVAASLNNLSALYWKIGRYDEAEAMLKRAVAIYEKNPQENDRPYFAVVLQNLGNLYHSRDDYAAAEEFGRRALAVRQELYGQCHPDVAQSLGNIANVLADRGDHQDAMILYRNALDIYLKTVGKENPYTAWIQCEIGNSLRKSGDVAGAVSLHREALAIQEQVLGRKHPDVATSLVALGHDLRAIGDLAEAESSFRGALAIREQVFGPDHFDVGYVAEALGLLMIEIGNKEAAATYLRRAAGIFEKNATEGGRATTRVRRVLDSLFITPQSNRRWWDVRRFFSR
jgi:tetratricopeptide (TPR) repeat protein